LRDAGVLAGLSALGSWPLRSLAALFDPSRVGTPFGVQAGDVLANSAVIWSAADRAARMWVDIADNPDFVGAVRLRGPAALPETGLTAKLEVSGLRPNARVHYRVTFEDLRESAQASEPLTGSLLTPAAMMPGGGLGRARDIRFVWSGDVVGQGWGINPDLGGMRIFETMRRLHPDFFIHSGDSIYADGPIRESVALPNGSVWRNVVTDAKAKVAETLDEFRGNFQYNLLDDNLRRFNAEVPVYAQWDDHEVLNNWYPGENLVDARYTETDVDVLAARAHQAFVEYMPVRFGERSRLYRHFSRGPLLDIFRIDLRSFRGPNTGNLQPVAGNETAYLGAEQLAWLKRALLESRGTWKVIASDMPIGLVVRDGAAFENGANADNGAPLGRELETAELLRFIREQRIHNVVWLTADVHYTAAHHYDPRRAAMRDFLPFWEFVSGPLNAGTFGPSELDGTFGPRVVYVKAPPPGQANLPPSAGLQFFGQVDIDALSGRMTVTLKDLDGAALFTQVLEPERGLALGLGC
jgi:alkaline phosphatase D